MPTLELVSSTYLPILIQTSVKERPHPFSPYDRYSEFTSLVSNLIKGSNKKQVYKVFFPYFAAILKSPEEYNIITQLITDRTKAASSLSSRSSVRSVYTSSTVKRTHDIRRTFGDFFVSFLFQAEELIVSGHSIDLSDQNTNALFSAFVLLQRMIRHCNGKHDDIIKLVAAPMKRSEKGYFSIFVSEFLWSDAFAPYAAKILCDLQKNNSDEALMFESYIDKRFESILGVIENSSNDDNIILSFIRMPVR